MVAKAVATLQAHCFGEQFWLLAFLFCFETRLPCVARASLELPMHHARQASSRHCTHRR